jgi:hypothetical protein
VYVSVRRSRVAFCVVWSKRSTYDFEGAVREPLKTNMSLSPLSLVSRTDRLYVLLSASFRVVLRVPLARFGLWLSGGERQRAGLVACRRLKGPKQRLMEVSMYI